MPEARAPRGPSDPADAICSLMLTPHLSRDTAQTEYAALIRTRRDHHRTKGCSSEISDSRTSPTRPNYFKTMLALGVGPSRLALRRLATSSRPILLARGPAPSPASLVGLRLLSTTSPVNATPRRPVKQRPVRNQLTEAEWPWRSLGNGEEERVIFARPVSTDPRMMWVFAVLWLGGVVTWIVMPSDRETSAYIAKQFPDAPKAPEW